ncbi:MAG TPA: quinolinate synthase NadA [Candidatus Goldiibacteriota bacterium]|nr:quinolinate synthase NadA [Candidatus Goldiibacteriota bacterium]
MQDTELAEKIKELKKKKNALIVAHNYQRPEIQDLADFTGDSLELSRKSAAAKEDIILFCGVSFMAETAKVLSPSKKVLIPRKDAGCQMADCIKPEDVDDYRLKYPAAVFVGYVNTTAAVKAKLDYCVTSANAVDIVRKIPGKQIVFLPDNNLGLWVRKNVPEKEIILHDGRCYVHHKFKKEDVLNARAAHPDAKVLSHPECLPEVLELSDEIASTAGMIKYAAAHPEVKKFVLGTEEGIIHRLKKDRPDAEFYSLGNAQTCFNMKLIRLSHVYEALEKEQFEVKLAPEIIEKAKVPIDRMVAL